MSGLIIFLAMSAVFAVGALLERVLPEEQS